MSFPLSLDFINKYSDYKKNCPKCGNETVFGLNPTDSMLNDRQFCRECHWSQKIYHKYFKEEKEKFNMKEIKGGYTL